MKKAAYVVTGLLATVPLLLAGPIVAAAAGNAAVSCSSSSTRAVDDSTVAVQVREILGNGKADAVTVTGLDDPSEQVPNAKAIVAAGLAMKVPSRGQVVALATALQESGLRNLPYGDRDSLGLFQQRPSQGWGTAQQLLDPVHATTRFYQALLEVPGWQSLSIAQAAQAVQHSALPDAYARWEPLAAALQRAVASLLGSASDLADTNTDSTSVPGTGSMCSSGAAGAGFGTVPAGTLPAGYTVPTTAPLRVQTAIRWALGQLGTEYQWGGSCTAAHGADPMGRCDCSSLVQTAYQAAGISLARTTFAQVTEGRAVPVGSIEPGDLVFTAGVDGSAAHPGHVGLAIGRGLVVSAPHTGAVVSVDELSSWQPQIIAVRRVT